MPGNHASPTASTTKQSGADTKNAACRVRMEYRRDVCQLKRLWDEAE